MLSPAPIAAQCRPTRELARKSGRLGPALLAARGRRDATCKEISDPGLNADEYAQANILRGDSDGAPPCRRCVQEQQECILVKSRRGGRRMKKSQAIPNGSSLPPPRTLRLSNAVEGSASCHDGSPPTAPGAEDRWQSRPATSPQQGLREWDDGWQEPASGSTTVRRQSAAASDIENHIASADLLNPSDALDLLAQVADRDAAESRGELQQHDTQKTRQKGASQPVTAQTAVFPPIADGYLAVADMLQLLEQCVCPRPSPYGI